MSASFVSVTASVELVPPSEITPKFNEAGLKLNAEFPTPTSLPFPTIDAVAVLLYHVPM